MGEHAHLQNHFGGETAGDGMDPMPELFNQQRHFVQVLLGVTGALGAAALAGLAWGTMGSAGSEAGILVGAVAGVLCVSMLISALATLPAARRAGRVLGALESGALVHWIYDQAFWQQWVQSQHKRQGRLIGWLAALIVVMGLAGAIVLATSGHAPGKSPPGAAIGLGLAGPLTAMGLVMASRVYRARRANRMMRCGECYLTSDAAYIGGDFVFWGAQMRALRGARIIDGEPDVLELSIGLSRFAGQATRAASAASMVAGGVVMPEDVTFVTRIPIPPGCRAEAQAYVARI